MKKQLFNNIINLFTKTKNLFTKIEIKKQKEDFSSYISPVSLTREYKKIKIPSIYSLKEINLNLPNILVMDDWVEIASLVHDELDRVQCCNVMDRYNILLATGIFAAFSVENALKEDSYNIDIAFLDITLGGVVDGVEYDGIDIAIMLKKKNPNCVIKFLTGHTLNRHNPELFKFIEKFENFFKVIIDETEIITFNDKQVEIYKHIINKNGNRVESFGHAVKEFEDIKREYANSRKIKKNV